MTWTITEEAEADYLRLRRTDPRGSRTDREALLVELRDECERLAATKEGRPRADGKLVYRGRKSRRYQYVVDASSDPPTLVQVRGESEEREQGSAGTLGYEIRRRKSK
jgi:hypothetical protein